MHIERTLLRLAIASLLAMPNLAGATCDLTEEYKNLRLATYKALREPFNQCRNSVEQWHYWKAFSKCEHQKAGEHVGGGCAHIAGLKVSTSRNDYNHCEVLRPTDREFTEALDEEASSKGISQCKPSSAQHE